MTASQPNVVLILADDLGWGDLGCYGADRIPTPHLDALAAEGIRFTDAHAASAVCTPSRYALLTGRYPWRSPLKEGVLMGHGPSLIEQDRPTIASVLHSAGYRTGAVGKWHLGLGWRHRDGSVWDARNPEDPMEYQLGDPLARHDSVDLDAGSTVDYSQPFTGGPLQLGFDRFFGIAGSLNMPPYAYLEQDRTRGVPTAMKSDFLPGQRPGYQAADWDEHEVDLTFVARAKEFIADESPEPFFLYFAPSAPHRPQVSPPRFRGTSGAGSRGDSVVFVDWMVGELVDALRDRGVLDDTIIVFTSDNGSPTIFADELDPAHRPNGPWRGQKGDTWEGGHREPLIVRWPHAVPAGTVSDEPVDLVDLMRSISVLVDITLPTDAAPDSRDRSRALRAVPGSESSSLRVISSMGGALAAIEHPWKVVFAAGSGGGLSGEGYAGSEPGQLYHLGDDPAETVNLWSRRADVVDRIRSRIRDVVGADLPFSADHLS
ncbi:MAG: arylsulfatase [Leifsonia sp.]|nr:arylsulfatase [Leifsonia sp.]|tara:strand:+ start:11449 stop:12912 length:1464 start_codon:yes stop_codon:yes gene_type:complete